MDHHTCLPALFERLDLGLFARLLDLCREQLRQKRGKLGREKVKVFFLSGRLRKGIRKRGKSRILVEIFWSAKAKFSTKNI
ncbi:hypothetical protein [Sulfitobacter sp. SK011]|uniref:hypothetical protein n=1 Tax=Sulfitobacter sp. SK011 TaxID=1389004 RepID=UPI0013B390ED|nr:hypothetical protein [Sulfitobacter sp. SK011]